MARRVSRGVGVFVVFVALVVFVVLLAAVVVMVVECLFSHLQIFILLPKRKLLVSRCEDQVMQYHRDC
jgi:hypothetical protein